MSSESRPVASLKYLEVLCRATLQGLPILQHVQRHERSAFLEAFVALGKSERNIMAANNAYLAEEALKSYHITEV